MSLINIIIGKLNLSPTKEKVVRNVIWAVIGKVVTLLGGLLVGIFVARYLGPEQYGLIIIRTTWLYSEFGKNFVKTMLNLTATKPQLKVVFDQVGTPTYAYDLAAAIYEIVSERKYEGNDGVYHFSNEGVCSWHDFTKMIAEYAEHTDCDIQPCHSDEFPSPVKRPSYSVLDKTKIKETFGVKVPYWTESLKVCLGKIM